MARALLLLNEAMPSNLAISMFSAAIGSDVVIPMASKSDSGAPNSKKPSKRLKAGINRARGWTALEALLALGIVGVLGAATTAWAHRHQVGEEQSKALHAMQSVHDAAGRFIHENQNQGCPTTAVLKEEGFLQGPVNDPWGGRIRIQCSGGILKVISPGPDAVRNTSDDLSIPVPVSE